MSSRFFLVTSTDRHILSSGHSFFLAIDCMIAVRNDCGLKKPASHTVVGRAKSVVQESSSWKKKRAAEGRGGKGRGFSCACPIPPPWPRSSSCLCCIERGLPRDSPGLYELTSLMLSLFLGSHACLIRHLRGWARPFHLLQQWWPVGTLRPWRRGCWRFQGPVTYPNTL